VVLFASQTNPPLTTLYIHLTNYCNMRCKHCWVDACYASEHISTSYTTLMLDHLKQAILQAIPLGLQDVLIGGGEPLLVKNLVINLAKLCYENGVICRIETNGTFINADLAALFKRYDCHISVSLDSHRKEYFDSFRGLKGAYEAVINAIKTLVGYDVNVRLVMTVTKENLGDVEGFIKLAKELGVAFIRINPVHPIGRALGLKARGLMLEPNDYVLLAKKLIEISSLYGEGLTIKTSLPIVLFIRHGVKWAKMAGGRCNYRNLLAILPDGSLSLCAVGLYRKELIIGNILHDSIQEVWTSGAGFLNVLRTLNPVELKGVCSQCVFNRYCANKCPAFVYLYYNTFKASYPPCQMLFENRLFPAEFLAGRSESG